VPNFERTQVKTECPNTVERIEQRRRREESKERVTRYISRLQHVDPGFKKALRGAVSGLSVDGVFVVPSDR